LLPTLARYVYANRFGGRPDTPVGRKTIYTIYNDTGHTFDGPALAVPIKAGEHLFDLLKCRPCEVAKAGFEWRVRLYLERGEVACLVCLPQRLTLARKGEVVAAKVGTAEKGWRLAICDAEGKELRSQEARSGGNRLALSALPAGSKPACVKLMRGTEMVDVAGSLF
jgi:hypothetical protein